VQTSRQDLENKLAEETEDGPTVARQLHMPPKSFIFNIASRSNLVCRSCRAILPRPQSPAPWIRARPLSQKLPTAAQGLEPSTKPAVPKDRGDEGGKEEDYEITFNFFEQELDGNLRRLRDGQEMSELMAEETTLAHLDELESKLKDAARLIKEIEQSDVKGKAGRRRKRYNILADDEDIRGPALATVGFTAKTTAVGRHRIDNLNKTLLVAAKKLEKGTFRGKHITAVWGSYSLARKSLAESWDVVPAEIWEFLWDLLARDTNDNPNRMSHIFVLARDMASAHVPLSDERQLLALEAMFIEGHQKEAIENWRKAVATLGSKPGTVTGYWELGARMCSLSGDLPRAEAAVDALFKVSPEADPRILFNVIRAYAKRDMKDKAWDAYRRLAERMGSDMKIEDYDQVVSAFLLAGETEYALHIFVDMMFSGAINLHGSTRLPSAVSNKFFFGKWLKRLIGAGDLDGAYNVLMLMQRKRIMPAAIQVNGLIGALMRSGSAPQLQRAEEIAMKMLESRRAFVDLRRREAGFEWPTRLLGKAVSKDGELTFLPMATLETYSLLAQNYKDRGLHEQLETLWTAFKQAEIASDSFMMNQLLESYVLSGRHDDARELYGLMVHQREVLPDAYTFVTLFRSLGVNRLLWLSVTQEQKEHDAALCRQFFSDMVRSSGAYLSRTEDTMLQALARTAIQTFRKVEDYVGLVVALRTLRAGFGFKVSGATAVELIAETGVERDGPKARQRIFQAREVLEVLLRRIKEGAELRGEPLDIDSPGAMEGILSAAVEEYFRHKVTGADVRAPPGRASLGDNQFYERCEEVAEELGIASPD